MDYVAAYLRKKLFQHALVRMARLARKIDAEGLSTLSAWERSAFSTAAAEDAFRNLDRDESPSEGELETAPLVWLQALDRFCRLEYCPEAFALPLQIEDHGESFWLFPREPLRAGGAYARQFGNLERWLRFHNVVPARSAGLDVAWPAPPHGYQDALAECLVGDSLRVAIAQFDDGVEIEWSSSTATHFRVTGLHDEERRKASALDLIRRAREAQVQILVLPELTITEQIRSDIEEILWSKSADGWAHDHAVPLVVTGSFHEACEDGWRNHSQLITGFDGTTLMKCDKRSSVTFEDGAHSLCEDISRAPEPFSIAATPIGLVTMAICKDFFDGPVAQALLEVGPDWVLVPSMSDNLSPHLVQSNSLGKLHGARVVVANQPMPGNVSAQHGFIQDASQLYDSDCSNDEIRLHVVELTKPGTESSPVLKVVG